MQQIITNIIAFILGNFNIWTPILAFIIALFAARKSGQWDSKLFSERFLAYFMLLTIGLMGIQGFIMHTFFGDFTAAAIGWKQSPFQYEVAIANLSFGVLGIIAFWSSFSFRLATGIGFSVWFFGDGVGHIHQLFIAKDVAAYNAGSTLYTDLILPIIVLILLFVVYRHPINH